MHSTNTFSGFAYNRRHLCAIFCVHLYIRTRNKGMAHLLTSSTHVPISGVRCGCMGRRGRAERQARNERRQRT